MKHTTLLPRLIPFLFMLSLLPQFYCKEKSTCNSPIIDSYFSFRLVDKYGMNQIAAWGARYLSDSTYFLRANGDLPNQLEVRGNGKIIFFIPDDEYEAVDSQISRIFLLYLPDFQGHPRDDIDTLAFKYRFKEGCYDEFRVYYNDSLYHQGEYKESMIFTKY